MTTADREALVARFREYDWDGQIGPVCRDIAAAVEGKQERIAGKFWDRYLAHSTSAKAVVSFTDDVKAKLVAKSAAYGVSKYQNPFDAAWMVQTLRDAENSYRHGTPLAALLNSFSAAHSATIDVIAETQPGSAAMQRMCDVVQRMAMFETDLLSSRLRDLQCRTCGRRAARERRHLPGIDRRDDCRCGVARQSHSRAGAGREPRGAGDAGRGRRR